MSAIADLGTQAQNQYNHGTFYVGSFVEIHDNPRIQSSVSDQSVSSHSLALGLRHVLIIE